VRRLLPVLCLAGALVVAGCSSFGVRNQDAATVNGVGIPTSRLTEMVQAQLGQQQQQQGQGQDIEGVTRQALEGLIQFELVLAGAREAGVNIDESAVDARIEQLKSQVAAQGQKYEDVLRERNISEKVVRDQRRRQMHAALAEGRHASIQHALYPVQFVAARRPRAGGVRPPDGKVHGHHQFAIANDDHQEDPINTGEHPVFLATPPGTHQA
jgi:hypothetical protein